MKTLLTLFAVAAFAMTLTACESGGEKMDGKAMAKAKCPASCDCGHCGTPDCKCKH